MRLYVSVHNFSSFIANIREKGRQKERKGETERETNGNKFSVRSKQFRNANILSFIMRIARGRKSIF